MEDPGADAFKKLFEESQNKHAEKLNFTETEQQNFKKAFDDPEFRKMFSEYVDELQNPANRAENEAYITQLEGEKKVPEGKELIRPKASFVAKTHKLDKDGKKTDEKIFINIVTSDTIAIPSKERSKDGDTWSLPYTLGPPHMEHDKNNSNVACFDCCFHPDVMKQMEANRRFQESLVMTAIEGIEEAYRRQKQDTKIAKEYHVLKGVTYKSGQISTMLVDSAAKKQQWNEKNDQATTPAVSSSTTNSASSVNTIQPNSSNPAVTSDSSITSSSTKPKAAAEPAIKRGFLNNAKTTVYPESVSAKDKSAIKKPGSGPNILLPGHQSAQTENSLPPVAPTESKRSLVQELQPSEIREKKTSTTTGNGTDGTSTNSSAGFGGLMHERTTTSKKSVPTATTPAVVTNQSVKSKVTETGDQVSSTSSSSSKGAADDAAPVPVGSDDNNAASKRPGYSLVERGVVSMGDFESLRSKVTVNRPAELVCKLEVPLVVKASEMVLDVSERQLKLSYRDIYDFTTALPYPVFDKKGVAKYDKVAKTLTVTLPVQPHTKEELSALSSEGRSNSSMTGVSEVKQKVPEGDEAVEVANDSNNSSNSKTTSPKSKSASSIVKQQQHSRWLHGSNTDEIEEARKRSEDLAKEVRESAEKAKTMAIATGGNPSPVAAPNQSKPSSITTLPPSPPEVADEDGTFMPCATFSGRRVGYVFKKGAKGMGYYLDTATVASGATDKTKAKTQTAGNTSSSQTQTSTAQKTMTVVPTATSASVAGSESSAVPLAFPFEYRQTPSSIAVLVQVPRIVADTAKVIFRATSVEVSFQATAVASQANSEDGDSNLMTVNYSLKLVVHGGFLELPRCKYDVAAKNMVLALAKREEGLWIESVDQPIVSAESLPIHPKDKATHGNVNAISVSPKATLVKSMVSNENKKTDNQNLADQLNSMKLSSAPAVFDLD